MCGIAGKVSCLVLGEEDHQLVGTMNDALHHRGPDSEGCFRGSHVSLAMRRLSIIDLAGGEQPLYNEDRSLAVIANGEIYNYIELADELRDRGHVFRTHSDIETILHLYEDFGVECVQHLRGMFAFALWDSRARRLLIARDRIGEKPLYLYQTADSLWFASELKALLAILPQTPEVDPNAIDLFFHYQYVPEPQTPFKNVRKLPAAHRLCVSVDPWQPREDRYWNPLDAPALDDSPAERIRAELEMVSRLVIRSDVPVGIALSGGLDSGAVALLSAPKYPETMRAFSVGYPGNLPNDERPQARALAQQLGIPFFDIELRTQDLVDFFPKLMEASDDPVADIAAYPQYAVMRLAAEHGVKVMLNGIGGDELFWGYQWVQDAAQKTQLRQQMTQRNTGRNSRWRWPWDRQVGPIDQLTFYDLEAGFIDFESRRSLLYTERMVEALSDRNAWRPFIQPQPWGSVPSLITSKIIDTWLMGNCIALGDRLSMASSVELRLPLLDYRLVEVVFGLRRHASDLALPPKAWLKDALDNVVPAELKHRPKRGFAPPIPEWLAALLAAYQDWIWEGLLIRSGYFRQEAVERLISSALNGKAHWVSAYKILVFEGWCRHAAKL